MSDKNAKDTKTSPQLTKIVEQIEKLNVLEVAELVKALEDKFGVTAAPVAITGAPTANAADNQSNTEDKAEFNVIITNAGNNKISVIKAIREIKTDLGLVEAKNLVDKTPATLLENAKKEDVQTAKTKLEEAGATVELQ